MVLSTSGLVPRLTALGEEGLPLSEREKRQAVVVRHNYGFGRVLFVGLDSTWRWRYKVGDLYHHRFWGQVVRWAASDQMLPAGNKYVRFGTREPVYRQCMHAELDVTHLSPDEAVVYIVKLM